MERVCANCKKFEREHIGSEKLCPITIDRNDNPIKGSGYFKERHYMEKL